MLDPDALATAICSTATVVPGTCKIPTAVKSTFEPTTIIRDLAGTASSFLIRPVMFAPVWALAVVTVGVLAEHSESASSEVAVQDAGDVDNQLDASVEEPATSEPGEEDSRPTIEESAPDASDEENSSTASSETIEGSRGAELAQTTSVPVTQRESSPITETTQAAIVDEAEGSTAAAGSESSAEESPEVEEPALQEGGVESPSTPEESELPGLGVGGTLTSPVPSVEQPGVRLVIGSEGGSSTVDYKSDVATGGPFVVDSDSSTFDIDATTGIVTVAVVPHDQNTVAFCSIEVGSSGRNESSGNPGQPVSCVMDLEPLR